jgi:hypothetical protein
MCCLLLSMLMNHENPFVMVPFDEFNRYFEKGHYYHAEYDEDVQNRQ